MCFTLTSGWFCHPVWWGESVFLIQNAFPLNSQMDQGIEKLSVVSPRLLVWFGSPLCLLSRMRGLLNNWYTHWNRSDLCLAENNPPELRAQTENCELSRRGVPCFLRFWCVYRQHQNSGGLLWFGSCNWILQPQINQPTSNTCKPKLSAKTELKSVSKRIGPESDYRETLSLQRTSCNILSCALTCLCRYRAAKQSRLLRCSSAASSFQLSRIRVSRR